MKKQSPLRILAILFAGSLLGGIFLSLAGCSHFPAGTPVSAVHHLQPAVLPEPKTRKPRPHIGTLEPKFPPLTEEIPLSPNIETDPLVAEPLLEECTPDATPAHIMRGVFEETQNASDREYNVLRRGSEELKEIALTFDDGPHPVNLPRLLDVMKQINVKGTFFLVGKKVDARPDIVARIVKEGHEIANHTYHHPNMTTVPASVMESEIRQDNAAIFRACGKYPNFFRPPGGRCNDEVLRTVNKLALRTALWTDNPADFARPGAAIIEARLLSHVRNGAVILLHSGIEQTADMLPDFVAQMRQQGYRFVTVSELAHDSEALSHVHP